MNARIFPCVPLIVYRHDFHNPLSKLISPHHCQMSCASFSWCCSLQPSLVSHLSTCDHINYCSLAVAAMHFIYVDETRRTLHPQRTLQETPQKHGQRKQVPIISVPEYFNREHGHHEHHAISDFSSRFTISSFTPDSEAFFFFFVNVICHWKGAAKPETLSSTQHTFIFH